MCSLFFLVILLYARGICSGKRYDWFIRHLFSSTCPTNCLPLFCWELNNGPAVVHCSCRPLMDCSGNSLLEYRLACGVRWEREVKKIPFNTHWHSGQDWAESQTGSLTFLGFSACSQSSSMMAQVDQHLIAKCWREVFWFISDDTANDW